MFIKMPNILEFRNNVLGCCFWFQVNIFFSPMKAYCQHSPRLSSNNFHCQPSDTLWWLQCREQHSQILDGEGGLRISSPCTAQVSALAFDVLRSTSLCTVSHGHTWNFPGTPCQIKDEFRSQCTSRYYC